MLFLITFIKFWNIALQKMLRSPYFFFDVIYLHNGADDQMDDSSWRVIFIFTAPLT